MNPNPKKSDQEKIDEVKDALDNDPFASIGKHYESASGIFDITKLFCYGCAHSASSEDFPGKPSGERPCSFCIRNPDREQWEADALACGGRPIREWYDKSPIAFYPMDAYQTLDMKEQMERWERKIKGEPNWNEPRGGLRFG